MSLQQMLKKFQDAGNVVKGAQHNHDNWAREETAARVAQANIGRDLAKALIPNRGQVATKVFQLSLSRVLIVTVGPLGDLCTEFDLEQIPAEAPKPSTNGKADEAARPQGEVIQEQMAKLREVFG